MNHVVAEYVQEIPTIKLRLWDSSLRAFREDRLTVLANALERLGDVVRIETPGRTFYLLAHPDTVQHVLRDHHEQFPKSINYQRLEPLLGEGLLTAQGAHWRRQRRLIQPVFTPRHVNQFAETMVRRTEMMIERWQRERVEYVDIADEMMRLTLEIISETMFGIDIDDEQARQVHDALDVIMEFARTRIAAAFYLEQWLPTPARRRFEEAIQTLDTIVYGIIEQRRREASPRHDLLGLLMQATDEERGSGMDDQTLRDEVMTIFLAGHETTANALTWSWYLLGKSPYVLRRLQKEIDDVLGTRAPSLDDLPALQYTDAILKESMRLYPPAWIVGRQPREDVILQGYHIPAGAFLLISSYITHRHPDFWDHPAGFDPDRWLDESRLPSHRFAYFPFGGGPRICIGKHFATLETKLVLTRMAQRYEITLLSGQRIEPQPSITLRPRYGVKVRLHPR